MLLKTLQLSVRCLRCTNVSPLQNMKTIKSQKYATWHHRRPIAVINEEIELNEAEIKPKPRKYVNEGEEHVPLKIRTRKRPSQGKHPQPAPPRTTFKPDGTLNYATVLGTNRELSALMMNVKSKKMRMKTKQILLEGFRLIVDGLKAGLKPEILMFSRPADAEKLPLPKSDVQLIKVSYKTLQLWSSLTTTPGIMGIFELPDSFEKPMTKDSIPLTIICDNVREPGNLGTILRAAAGVGCERVIVTKGCVDLWDSKVLRSAAGAHFRVCLSYSVEWEDVESLISPSASVYAADNNVAVISKNEILTPSDESQNDEVKDEDEDEDEEEYVYSPEEFEPSEKMVEQSVKSNASEKKLDAPHETTSLSDEEKTFDKEPNERGNVRKVSVKELAETLPIIPYYTADYTRSEVVLIVGGETHGLSYEAIELIRKKSGVRVNVPLVNGVESLNTGMALGIVAFEMGKQFLVRKNEIAKE